MWRLEAGRIIAGLVRLTGDVGLAEDLGQEALIAALERWPRDGIPPNPGAWLALTARNRALDVLRRRGVHDRKIAELGRGLPGSAEPDLDAALDDPVGDDLLRLIFISCHPALRPEGRAALTLRLLGGLTTEEIARAFLITEAAASQRIVRAKRTLAERKVPYELPTAADLPARLGSVLGVVYLIFNEGYAATSGDDWIRPSLCEEAMRLARLLSALLPDEPETHGLQALTELHGSRLPARTAPDGSPILLADQDRRRWDHLLVRRGLAALERAAASGPPGHYTLQAAIAACHATAPFFPGTDWPRITALYALLSARWPSPMVTLNHALAVAMSGSPEEALAMLTPLTASLPRTPLLPATRAHILALLNRPAESRSAYLQAASLTPNPHQKSLYLQKAHSPQTSPPTNSTP
ncbi:sigma-70 family RNA polymerase sigma factor [Actinocorallia aurea]